MKQRDGNENAISSCIQNVQPRKGQRRLREGARETQGADNGMCSQQLQLFSNHPHHAAFDLQGDDKQLGVAKGKGRQTPGPTSHVLPVPPPPHIHPSTSWGSRQDVTQQIYTFHFSARLPCPQGQGLCT